MAYRKVILLIDCDNDQEKATVQSLCDEISNMRVLTGRDIVTMAPKFRQHKEDFIQLFRMISKGGPKALLSIEGAKLLSKFTKSK